LWESWTLWCRSIPNKSWSSSCPFFFLNRCLPLLRACLYSFLAVSFAAQIWIARALAEFFSSLAMAHSSSNHRSIDQSNPWEVLLESSRSILGFFVHSKLENLRNDLRLKKILITLFGATQLRHFWCFCTIHWRIITKTWRARWKQICVQRKKVFHHQFILSGE
jgi:hypothetical protein